MTVTPFDMPLSAIPLNVKILERDVHEMERMLDLLRRRDAAAAELTARGVAITVDSLKPIEIIELVAARRQITVARLRGRERIRDIAWARHEVFYLMSIQVKADGSARWSLTQIGQRVPSDEHDAYDHTTVLSGIRNHAKRIDAAARGEKPAYARSGRRPSAPRAPRAPALPRQPATVCMLPAGETCPGCGALGGEPCFDGARRG